MKTLSNIRRSKLRTSMRDHALHFRECIHPDSSYQGHADRIERAAFYVRQAVLYRGMAAMVKGGAA